MRKPWTKEELELIKNQYGKVPVEELAEKLGRSKSSVYDKAHYLDLCSGRVWNKTEWTAGQDEFLRRNFQYMTNGEIASVLGMKKTVVRMRAYYLGLQRMKLQYWTEEQVQFLQDNFRYYGDTELAEMFAERWEKEKGWSKKHIEKKRRYLNLKRTPAERKAIFKRNKENGAWAMCPVHAWKTRGVSHVGKIKTWNNPVPTPYIKTATGWERLSRFIYEYNHGTIQKGYNILHLDGNLMNCRRSNLKLVSDAELANENSASILLTDNYVAGMLSHGRKDLREKIKQLPDMIQLKRTQLQLNRELRNYEKDRK